MRRGVYPGSFNPLTVAHLAVAEAAHRQCRLHLVDLAVSRITLAKEGVDRPLLRHRVEVLEAAASARPWLGVIVSDAQLLADIAAGYDVLVLGADKWAQIQDPAFYGGSPAARDRALARLPAVAVAPRPPHPLPSGAVHLDVSAPEVSSTAARDGARHLMAPEALAFDERTGAWSEPERYERWLASRRSS